MQTTSGFHIKYAILFMDEKKARKNKIINVSLLVLLIAFIAFRLATACNMLE